MKNTFLKSLAKILFSKQSVAIVIIIAITYFLTWLPFDEKSTEKPKISEASPVTVKTIVVEKVNQPVMIQAFGTVEPDRELSLSAEIDGKIIEISDQLDEGGIVKKGEVLIQVDQRDFINSVEEEKGKVETAILELRLEKGKQRIAERDWKSLAEDMHDKIVDTKLVLREPHLKEKIAALKAAEGRLKKAQLDLERTTIVAPFDAIVVEEAVEVGANIFSGDIVAKLIAIDQFRVELSLPLQLSVWINFPSASEEDESKVTVIQDLGNEIVKTEGQLLRLLPDLDPTGRMARVLVAIKDPLKLNDPSHESFPFLIGTYVEVQIEGKVLEDIIIIPRLALHEGNTIWIKNANHQLEIREVDVVYKKGDSIFIASGIEDGEEVITSSLAVPIKGMKLESVEREY